MWVGLLFSILGQAAYLYAVCGEELHTMPEPHTSMWELSSFFRERTAQCLVEVNYLRPRRYTVETLCLYYALETWQAKASEFGAYVLLGIIVRVAMRLGYHRDASHYPKISPFDGEMQRRVWSSIFQLDLMTSAQVGLPRMIRDSETDTAEPKNLLDTDIDESMVELPHPRPNTEATSVAYAIFKLRLLRQLGLIVDQLNSITPPPYNEVMRLDSSLMEMHARLPPYMTMRPLSLSITDDAKVILQRFVLEVSFQKSRCVLHRKYLIPGKSNPQFRYSRTASVDAAMKLLDVQLIFHEASQPGGQLFGEQWRKAAIINQDYVLAAMILCLDLAWGMRVQTSDLEDEVEAMWPRHERLQRLRRSYELWCRSSSTSALAAKAAQALRVMLKDLSGDSASMISRSSSANISGMNSAFCFHISSDGIDRFRPRSCAIACIQ
jgi:Fungal specific transcription factor domain